LKYLIIFNLLFNFSIGLNAQSGVFLDTTMRWWVVYNCIGPCGALDKYRSYYFEDDTIIENNKYLILKGLVTKSMILDLPIGTTYNAGYFREDTSTKNIYTYFFGNSLYNIRNRELLLYSFKLNINDSFYKVNPCSDSLSPVLVIRKEKIDTNSNLTKFIFSDSSYYDELNTLINLPTIIDTQIRCSFFEPFIQCVKAGKLTIYGDKCNEVSSTSLNFNVHVLVYPNPINDYLNIDLPIDINATLLIYSLYHTLIMNVNLNVANTNISCSKLLPGLYFYKIFSKNKNLKSGIFIKI
jgi:hypothetical protein